MKKNNSAFVRFRENLELLHVSKPSETPAERVKSVDALRGFDMFWIMGGDAMFSGLDYIFNNRISAFLRTQMDHVEWTGFHFYDIIMPLFLFLVGVSLVYSFRKRLGSGAGHGSIWKHTIKRVLILWILGMAVQGNLFTYDIEQFQLYSNTLQAIASGYLIATILVLYLPVFYQIVATAGLMLAYWAIAALIPVNGSTAGAWEMSTNVPLLFDHMILGRFDDGLQYSWIISSLNFGATTMLGVFCGYLLQSKNSRLKKLRSLLILGAALIAVSLVWDLWQPIIKKIWTSSFVLFSGGICILMLALFYYVIDILEVRRGTRWLIVLGSNAIFGYVAWHLFSWSFIGVARVFWAGFISYIPQWEASLSFLGGFLVIYLLMSYMYRNKTFIKI
ncbi:MAG: acyltransferase family protein [Bacteroidota bacterium]